MNFAATKKRQWVAKLILAGLVTVLASACASQGALEFYSPEQRALDIHATSFVLDAHADVALPKTGIIYLAEDGSSKVSPEKLRAGGIGAIVMSLAVGPGERTANGEAQARALFDEKLTAVQKIISDNDDIILVTSPRQVSEAKSEGKIALLLGFQNARSLEGNVDALDDFYGMGVRVFGLNHLGHNAFSDSSRPEYDGEAREYEPENLNGGLSSLGRSAIKRINRLGGIVDVTQMSKMATLQTIELSSVPVIASHSNVKSVTNVTRNMSDEEIDKISEAGGVIHIAPFGAYLVNLSEPETLENIRAVRLKYGLPEEYSYPYELYWELETAKTQGAFLTEMRKVIGRGSIADLIKHIDYVVSRVGINHVGIGSDFNHGSGIEGFEDASDALNVTMALIESGYRDADIQKIWGGNFIRVFRAAEKFSRGL